VVAVTPGDVTPPLSPVNLGTHGVGDRIGIAIRPVAGSQWSCHVYLAVVPAFWAAWYWFGTALAAGVSLPPPLGVTVAFLSSLPLTANTTATIAITTRMAMNGA